MNKLFTRHSGGYKVGKYRFLGSVVLVYAFLTSGVLLSIALGWTGAVNGALWLVYVLGGVGMIREKGWGRILTLLAASGSLILVVVFPIVGDAEFFYFPMVSGLPALAIFVSALLVKLPPSKEVEIAPSTGENRKPRISQRTSHDIAYVSFMVLSLISFWTSYFIYSEIQAAGGRTGGIDGVLGFLVIIPFGIPLLFALILGPGLSVFLWRDYRLMTLTVLTIALLIALSTLGYKTWSMLLSLYAVVCMTVGLLWFIKYRRLFR